MVKKDIAELHFDHQVWTDPVLPDRREHHSICNADSILPIAADGVVLMNNAIGSDIQGQKENVEMFCQIVSKLG